ncbi:hypothetical protein IFM89_013301 [Coptis chinensis]|uniref:KIB1-4 beta-propeller domain-containing protein n=1 Tax=Coptis chinensis TaxID=261450 RepID=A0A835LMC3_9MAGN|nr:hypothetical protein IFM89_013301 [Coptis chinensis]
MDWSMDLTEDLLDEIASRIGSHADYVRLRAVSPAWRTFLPKLPRHQHCASPGLMFPMRNTYCDCDCDAFNLFMANDVLEYNPERIGMEYSVRSIWLQKDTSKFFSLAKMKNYFIEKFVLSSSPTEKNCLAMAIFRDCNKLACCRLGDEGWKNVEGGLCHFQDIIYFNGKFYALSILGRLFIVSNAEVEASSPMPTFVIGPPDGFSCSSGKVYLVESSGELLMVDRGIKLGSINKNTLKFSIFKLNVYPNSLPTWSKVMSLGDRMLFLGQGESFSFSSRDLPGPWKGNHIYFTDDHVLLGNPKYQKAAGSDYGVFNLEDECFQTLPLPLPAEYKGRRTRIWPPPIWILPNSF